MSAKYIPIVERFPSCYRKFLEDLKRPRARVICRGPPEKYWYDESQRIVFREPDARIPTMSVPESQRGLWGGEGAVKGFRVRKSGEGKVPTMWFPHVYYGIYYSEILDKYFRIQVTEHARMQIDDAFGLDNYILKTPVQDLNSQMAFDLRRKMLLALARKEMHPDNEEKRDEVLKKYAEFIIPEEEAEWFGLSLRQATWKLLTQEQEAKGTPKKAELRAKFIESLRQQAAKQ